VPCSDSGESDRANRDIGRIKERAGTTNTSMDTATLDLLASWRLEDSNPTSDQIRDTVEQLR
jgi:hypothetical protein